MATHPEPAEAAAGCAGHGAGRLPQIVGEHGGAHRAIKQVGVALAPRAGLRDALQLQVMNSVARGGLRDHQRLMRRASEKKEERGRRFAQGQIIGSAEG